MTFFEKLTGKNWKVSRTGLRNSVCIDPEQHSFLLLNEIKISSTSKSKLEKRSNMSMFKNWPEKNQSIQGDTLYADISRHCPAWQQYFFSDDKGTTAHESTHCCNSDVRNDAGGQGVNGFYVGYNRAIVVPEPNTRKSDCIKYIPDSLKGSRYNLYIEGQQEWDDRPLYLLDEGVAYCNQLWALIELKQKEGYADDAIPEGPVEFSSYMVATLMAADAANSLNDTLKKFGKWILRRGYNSYFEGLKIFPPYDVQDKIYEIQKSGSEWAEHRNFLKEKLDYDFPSGVEIEDDDGGDGKINYTP